MEQLIDLLREKTERLKKQSPAIDLSDTALDQLYAVYPFNRFEYVFAHLIAGKIITLDEYLQIRRAYEKRNKYLHVFEITAPRTFGEQWAQKHLNELLPALKKPSKQLDPGYAGEYDFWLDGIKIEVKASRAVKRKSGDPLIFKALSSDSKFGFDMNFQQIKPKCCDVFVWIGVWRDLIRYWVLSSAEVQDNPYFSTGQHRGNTGEGQLWIKESNIEKFNGYEVAPDGLLKAIKRKGSRR